MLDTTGIIVNSDQITDLGTIKLPFSGIPIPKNLSISYDTILKIVIITWDKPVIHPLNHTIFTGVMSGLIHFLERINVNPWLIPFIDNTIAIDTIYEYTVVVNSETWKVTKGRIGNFWSLQNQIHLLPLMELYKA